jgi:transposase InsO family protein
MPDAFSGAPTRSASSPFSGTDPRDGGRYRQSWIVAALVDRPIQDTRAARPHGCCISSEEGSSTGSVGDAYDNAMAEAFFATLECELLDRRSFRSQAEARMAVFAFIESLYNSTRRHSALGYLSPLEYEARAMAEDD